MSYPDPPDGPLSREWPNEAPQEGRDVPVWARHGGAAPDAYAAGAHRPEPRENAARAAYAGGVGTDDAPRPVAVPPWDAPTGGSADDGGRMDHGETAPADDRAHGRGRRRAGRSGRPVLKRAGRAGRNLRAAIVVGASLVALVLAALIIWPPALVGILAVAAGVGIWEMVRAVRGNGVHPPLVPLLGGAALMNGLAWVAGPDALALGLLVTVVAAVVWRLGDGPRGFQRDIAATALIAVYVPFLLAFGVLMVKPGDGPWRVLVTLLAVVLSDTGGYAVGVFLGRHKMAPLISPGKSWEGFAGSVGAAAAGGAVLLWLLLDVAAWKGAVFGAVIAVAAVVGDLAESMIKRDLKIKDMSHLLPGHGGLMDRLDSILLAVPTAFLLLSLLAPPS
jgi:phosphatidate cytidylyltransferase